MSARTPTKDPKTAVERLAPLVPGVEVERAGRGFLVSVAGASDMPPAEKSSLSTLAFLADLLPRRDRKAARDLIRWRVPNRNGRITLAAGLAGWEEDALLTICED